MTPYLLRRLALKNGLTDPPAKPPPKIAKKSAKRKQEEKEYRKIVAEMFLVSGECEMKTPVCTRKAQGLHHKKKRGKNYLNKEYLMRACNACNGWAEQYPKEAKELGLILSKFS